MHIFVFLLFTYKNRLLTSRFDAPNWCFFRIFPLVALLLVHYFHETLLNLLYISLPLWESFFYRFFSFNVPSSAPIFLALYFQNNHFSMLSDSRYILIFNKTCIYTKLSVLITFPYYFYLIFLHTIFSRFLIEPSKLTRQWIDETPSYFPWTVFTSNNYYLRNFTVA